MRVVVQVVDGDLAHLRQVAEVEHAQVEGVAHRGQQVVGVAVGVHVDRGGVNITPGRVGSGQRAVVAAQQLGRLWVGDLDDRDAAGVESWAAVGLHR